MISQQKTLMEKMYRWKSTSMKIYHPFKETKILILNATYLFFRGYVLIIVNVASKCGYTSKHYKELVELDEKYREKGLRILGFPCNQFGSQVNIIMDIIHW